LPARRIIIVRPPHTSGYNEIDVREDALASYLLGFLSRQPEGCDVRVFDFHLDRHLSFGDLIAIAPTEVIITVRETGANVHYALRIANALRSASNARIFLYGQIGRLIDSGQVPVGVELIQHDEGLMARAIGMLPCGKTFADGLVVQPYFSSQRLTNWQTRHLRASIETSRGCPYKCRFCFINVGKNYPERWTLRPNAAILADIDTYYALGIRAIVFHDSEFFGVNSADYATRTELFRAIEKLFPGIAFKIYARADTLIRYNNVELMRRAGLREVFIGVESLDDDDLRTLRKGLSSKTVVAAVNLLKSSEIKMNLSFMLFNRNTTIRSIRHNIATLKELFQDRPRLMGMPNFLFSFEADWNRSSTAALSQSTYLRWMVYKRAQPGAGVLFDPVLEPLAEAYRLLAYDLTCKLTRLSRARDTVDALEDAKIERWFEQLGMFCLDRMDWLASAYEFGKVTFQSNEQTLQYIKQQLSAYYQQLPEWLRGLEINNHFEALAAGGVVPLEDHGWDVKIPLHA
jgi:hypothetical protein